MDRKLNRRDFLKKSAGTGAAALIGGGLAWPRNGAGLPRPALSEFPDVAVVQGQDYLANTRKAVDLSAGSRDSFRKNARVAILPNAQSAHPGTFTKPDIVRAVVRMCKAAGAREVNCLSWLPEKFWAATGLAGVLKEEGAELKIVDLRDEAFFQPVALPKGKILREAMIMKELFANDCLINLPITKDHAGNKFTGAMKNLMGLNFAAGQPDVPQRGFQDQPRRYRPARPVHRRPQPGGHARPLDRRRHGIHHHQRPLRAGRAGRAAEDRRRSGPDRRRQLLRLAPGFQGPARSS